jgi:hypothetical protein
MLSILSPVRTREALAPVEKLADWELFKSLASELISPNIHIHSYNEAHKAAHDFAASVAYTSSNMTYWKIPHKKARTKGPIFYPVDIKPK